MNKIIDKKPVIAILGHINHGKTSLVDHLKQTTVVESEVNSITQHIGAYEVFRETPDGNRYITLIDTPGHSAFAHMRRDSISTADIALLLIASDDGVKDQTKDALEAINKNKIPFIVVFTKIDIVDSSVLEKTKLSVLEHGIMLEGLGGTVPYVTISSKTGKGVNDLLDTILLLYDTQEETPLQSDVSGIVLEVGVDMKKGIYADIITKIAGINKGDFLTADHTLAPTRIMTNADGKTIESASCGTAVRIYGFSNIPSIGAIIRSHKNKKEAIKYISTLSEKNIIPQKILKENSIPVILKTDTVGSVFAIEKEINKLSTEEFPIEITRTSVGVVTDSDIKNAKSINKNSIVLAFSTKIDANTADYASRQNITIVSCESIYELVDWMKKYLEKNTQKQLEHKGTAVVIRCFITQKNYQVFGAKIKNGEFCVGNQVSVTRFGKEILREYIINLEKSNEKFECVSGEKVEFAIRINTKQPIQIKDILESFA